MSLVTTSVADAVADVRLSRPEALNGLTVPMLHELAATARRLGADRSVRAIVLSGEGRSFCAGLDFATVMKKPAGLVDSLTPRPWRGTNPFQEAAWAWRRVPVPVIAAVHGHCFGGGLQIAMACDFRVTAPDAQWSVLEGKWGLIPDMTGVRTLADQIGMERAKRLTMTTEIISGEQALEWGLVGEVADDPRAAAGALAAELITKSPDAVAGAKRLFNRRWNSSPRATFAAELVTQLGLLRGRNAGIARAAGAKKQRPEFGPRGS